MISFLFLETGMIGALVALDLVLFYVFWEVMLIPMYLLIGVWVIPRDGFTQQSSSSSLPWLEAC